MPTDDALLIAASNILAALIITTTGSTFGKKETESLCQRALAMAEELLRATARRKRR